MADIFPGATLMQLVEWGYPLGALRSSPAPDKGFSVVHITGNSRLPTGQSEAAWRINDTSLQNSATFFVNRDGSVVQCLSDPLRMAPWANGDLQNPDTSNPRIAAVVRDRVNANQRTVVAIENVGYEPGSSITAAQEAANARIIAHYHAKAGIPVSRQTVVGHYQINAVNRPNCPGVNKALIDRIVAMALPRTGGSLVLIQPGLNWQKRKYDFAPGVVYNLFKPADDPEPANWTERTTLTGGTSAMVSGPWRITTSAFDGERLRLEDGYRQTWYIGSGPQPTPQKEPEAQKPDCTEAAKAAFADAKAKARLAVDGISQ